MSRKEKPLPKPPGTPFGRKRRLEEEQTPLMADELAKALAEGKLEEFLEKELPEGEYARKLASMMMGMTGLLPPGGTAPAGEKNPEGDEKTVGAALCGRPSSSSETPPEDVLKAAKAGDVKELMGLLEREHKKRVPEAATPAIEEAGKDLFTGLSPEEKETLDDLMRIAEENKLSLNWVVLRALRLYVEEHRKTGRL